MYWEYVGTDLGMCLDDKIVFLGMYWDFPGNVWELSGNEKNG